MNMNSLIDLNYRKIFEDVPGVYLILAPDENFTILATNKARDAVTMRAAEDVIGRGVFEAFPDNPNDPDATGVNHLKASLNRVLKKKGRDKMPIQKYDIRNWKGEFEERYWSPLNVPVLDDKGEVQYIIHYVEDVTDFILSKKEISDQINYNKELKNEIAQRNKAEKEREEIREEQRRWLSIADTTPDYLARFDVNGHVTYMNGTWKKLHGIKSEYFDLTLADLHSPEHAALLLTVGIPSAMEKGVWMGESSILDSNKKLHYVSEVLLLHKNTIGEIDYFTLIGRDIADSKHREYAQRFLAESTKSLTSTLEYESILKELARLSVPFLADFSVIIFCENGRDLRRLAVFHTDKEKQMMIEQSECCLGGSEKSPVGALKVIRSGKSELVPQVVEAWLSIAAISSDQLNVFKTVNPRSLIIVPLKARNHTLGAAMFAISESDRRYDKVDLALAEELASRAALAADNALLYKQSMESTQIRDEVLRIVAHDLRNPLNTISLNAEILLREAEKENSDKVRKRTEMIKFSVQRADRLINDLLDVAKAQAGKIAIEKKSLDTDQLLDSVVKINRPEIENHGLTFEVKIERNLPQLFADHDRIFQIFSNLFGNAIKFTLKGGKISLKAEKNNAYIKFSVTDTGPGIPSDQIPHLFEPFWQADKKSRVGAGLGLAIVKGLVEAHGGTISVHSKTNQGTTFSFTIPIFKEEEQFLH